jgi:sensor histidine kinase regulating citrate/malate metabolism
VWLAANGGEVLAAALPLRTGGGEVIGALVTSRSTSELAEPFAQAGRSLVLVGLAALLVSAPVSWALARRLARLAAPRG